MWPQIVDKWCVASIKSMWLLSYGIYTSKAEMWSKSVYVMPFKAPAERIKNETDYKLFINSHVWEFDGVK